MKKLLILLLSALSLTVFAQQKKVAVYVTGTDASINKVVGSKLVSAIARGENLSAVERTESFLLELNKEQNYQRTGAVDDTELSELGKQFGVQYVCVAAVFDAFNEKYLSVRLINVETALVECTASSAGAIKSLDDIVNAANSVSNELFSLLGRSRQSNSKKVAIYVINNEAGRNIGRVLGDKLVAGFSNSGRYIAIERTDNFLSQLQKEQNYQRSGFVDDNEISRLGKQFGVNYVCVADISDVFGEKYISVRLIDVETAEVVNSHEVGGEVNSMMSCLKMANEITDVLSQFTIAELSKEKQRIEYEGFVDLGLPSGTCWKKTNEERKMTYNDAVNNYRGYLPNQEQCSELKELCEWVLVNDGVRVIGPNGNYITLKATEEKEDAIFYASYLALPTFPTYYSFGENKWYKCLHDLCIWTDRENLPIRGYRGHIRSFGSIDQYETSNEEWGIILCQQVEALSKRLHDDRTLTTKKEYTTLYTKSGEFYCDGSYSDPPGQIFESPNLDLLNEDYFRVTFSFKAISYEGINKWKNVQECQYPLVLSRAARVMSLCLHNDGTIFIVTNNGDHKYETTLKYIPNQYCNIDLEYYKGLLTINGQKIWVKMDMKKWDKKFSSVNYSNGYSFLGYLKDVEISNVTNVDVEEERLR